MEPYFLTFQDQDRTESTAGIDPDVQVLVFQEPVTRTVLGGPLQRDLLLVTPGGVPGLPGSDGLDGATGPIGPVGPIGSEPDLLDLTLLFENGLI